jgi:hypothetical protein
MMMGRADIAKGFAALYKEGAKLDGMPVLQVVKMGVSAEGMPQQGQSAGGQAPPAPPPPTAGEVAGDAATGAAASRSGRLGGLAGGLGGLGGFGRRKKQQQEQPAAPAQQPQSADVSGALMEMTTELSGFSSAAVDGSKFEVPAGFKQVESEMKKGARR